LLKGYASHSLKGSYTTKETLPRKYKITKHYIVKILKSIHN